ncbi:FAD-dependent monooxygenase [Actibacterium lipolyticum]|uniref:3-hydroxybenzoate 6-hydroxylase n=1 Tax=Actibacterium lipolyticum TaxID=1524263 RepID=A0A238JV63_9RHOB|nr:FAD-dependent monooxygenase [Actibacterium lipolyticum]SMX34485.1 3-hydroxybenzoate 6-hydroxylase [Actibacterium lipolyticum]
MLIGRKFTVLGGGIGGLAAATALAQRGAQVTVLEQADAIREVGAGMQISPNGAAVLRGLGLGPMLEDMGVRARAVRLVDFRKSSKVLELDLSKTDGAYYFVHRADLHNLLATAAREAGVKLRLLQKITNVELCGEEGVRVTSAQGAERKAQFLIGADGLHSVLRDVVNGPSTPEFTGQVAWRATVPVDESREPVVTVHMGPGRHIVSYPLRGGKAMNFVAVEERDIWAEESWSHTDDPENLRAAFAGFAPDIRALLDRVESVHLWGLFRHPVAETWFKGNAALIGDAAHPTLPFLAQGANMALEDAWALTSALANNDDTQQALAAYQAVRRKRCEKIVDAASKNARNYHLSFPPLRFAAHTALRVGGALAPSVMLGKFDWLYGYDVTQTCP